MNINGPFLIDTDSFVICQEKSIDEIEKNNIEDLKHTFLYGFLWKVGQFATRQTFDEIFDEIKNFDGSLFQYVQYKNPYDYGTNTSNRKI